MRTTKFTESTCHDPSKQLARDMVYKHQIDYIDSFKESPKLFTIPCLPWIEASHELKLAKQFAKRKQHLFHIQAKENDYGTWAEMIKQFKKGKHWIQKFSKRATYEDGVFFAAKGNVQIQLDFDDWTWEDVANNPCLAWGDFCGMPLSDKTTSFFQNIKPRRSYALTFFLNPRNSYPSSYDSRLIKAGYNPSFEPSVRHEIVSNFLVGSMPCKVKRSDSIFYWNGVNPMVTYLIETN